LKIEESRSTAGELATFDPEVAQRVKAALDKSERLMIDSIRRAVTFLTDRLWHGQQGITKKVTLLLQNF
jgi:hypothetical protein